MATMKEITYAQAINDAMCEEMQRDENVFMMGEDIAEYCGAFGVSRGMLEKFGKDRIMNTPISEQAYVGAGIGSGESAKGETHVTISNASVSTLESSNASYTNASGAGIGPRCASCSAAR